MDEVTGTIVEAGNIPVDDDGKLHTYERALVIQFDSVEDLRAAMSATSRIRGEWQATD